MSPSGISKLGSTATKTDTAEKSLSLGREFREVCLGNRHHSILAGFTTRWQLWQNVVRTGDKKAFCVLEFAKTESIVTVQLRFRTKYHTEPPMDKTIRE
jgi:hypothetical protein